jgi:hypothetical protein
VELGDPSFGAVVIVILSLKNLMYFHSHCAKVRSNTKISSNASINLENVSDHKQLIIQVTSPRFETQPHPKL